MKKIFTLMAALFLCSGAVFAQDEEDPQEEPGWDWWQTFDPYVCHEFRDTTVAAPQFNGPAEIVEDPVKPGNHCARVIVRSQDEAIAAQNMIADGDHIAGWDSQFFVCSKTAIPEGYEVKLVMKVRADFEGDTNPSCGTQAHNDPGNYNHWACVGNLEFTRDWREVEMTGTVDANWTQSGAENPKEFHSIAFNLADYRNGYTAYFDDIKLYVREKKETQPQELTGWFNLLRKGNNTDDILAGTNWHTFTGRDANVGLDLPARVIADPVDGQPCYTVTCAWFNNIEEEEYIDEETGEPMTRENKWYEYENADGEVVVVKEVTDWQSQFFMTVPHKFGTGQQYKVRMWARSDVPCTVQTQAHRTPGDYQYWAMIGDLNLTPEWKEFVIGDTDINPDDVQTISSDQDGCRVIAFNTNVFKDEPNNIYFRFDEFCFNDADVPIDERTLGSEDITLNVTEKGAEKVSNNIDFTNCMEVLELSPRDLGNLLESGSVTVQRKPIKLDEDDQEAAGEGWENVVPRGNMEEVEEPEPENPSEDPQNMEVQYEPDLSFLAGFPLSNLGIYDDEGQFELEGDEIEFEATTVPVYILNEGESFADQSVTTAFFFVSDGWNYRFNATIKGAQTIPDAIEDVTTSNNQKVGVIYDLSGRRIVKPAKGLYIMDGKKVLVK